MAAPQLGPGQRYRCGDCGNLTRFTVTKTVRSRGYHHFTVGGELIGVEEEEVLSVTVEDVACRWCSNGGEIVTEDLPGSG